MMLMMMMVVVMMIELWRKLGCSKNCGELYESFVDRIAEKVIVDRISEKVVVDRIAEKVKTNC